MSRQGARFDEQTWTAVVLTVVALLAMATAALLGPSLSSNQTPVRLPDISPSMIPLVSGQEPIGRHVCGREALRTASAESDNSLRPPPLLWPIPEPGDPCWRV